ncbi:MAG: helix-turn-helix domain-containing protein [Varibaculum timonense]
MRTEYNHQEEQLPRYLSIKEAARFAGVATNTARHWVYRDGLPAVRRGRVVRIETAALIEGLQPNINPVKGKGAA